MVTKEQFKSGLGTYVERELVPKVGGIKKWMLLAGAMELIASADSYLDKMNGTSYIQKDGMIDIDKLYKDMHRIAESTGPVTEHIPIIGDVTFDSKDIDSVYRCILS